jgi:hypothetical protein
VTIPDTFRIQPTFRTQRGAVWTGDAVHEAAPATGHEAASLPIHAGR